MNNLTVTDLFFFVTVGCFAITIILLLTLNKAKATGNIAIHTTFLILFILLSLLGFYLTHNRIKSEEDFKKYKTGKIQNYQTENDRRYIQIKNEVSW